MSTLRILDPNEIRLLGALLEKEQTTPDLYPLTVNSLLAAANQKSNRDPVTQLTEEEVWDSLEQLRRDVLVWRHEGARAEKWSQSVSRRLELDSASKAILTVLMLRGPQTPGELRSRTGRMRRFGELAEVEETLQQMATGEEPLAVELPRQAGRRERRWAHLLGGPVAAEPEADPVAAGGPAAGNRPTAGLAADPPAIDRLAALEQRVTDLATRLAVLEAALGESPDADEDR